MSLTPMYKPIDGEEGKEIIKRAFNKKVDAIPMMKKGHSYHRFQVDAVITISANPKDTPVPEVEFKRLIEEAKDVKPTFETVKQQVEHLENSRTLLLKKLETIDKVLAELRPQEVITIKENTIDANGNDTPDSLRIKHDMPVTMIQRTGAGVNEVKVPANKIQVQP